MQISEVLNTVIHGDCLQVMKQLPDECIDLIITSPPYNIRNSTGNGFKSPIPEANYFFKNKKMKILLLGH